MITNEAPYPTTRTPLARFEEAIANLEGQAPGVRDQMRRSLELGALRSQAADLKTELVEYDNTHSASWLVRSPTLARHSTPKFERWSASAPTRREPMSDRSRPFLPTA
jgi:hypothetical protein